jgi:hypothetical protein
VYAMFPIIWPGVPIEERKKVEAEKQNGHVE